MNTKAKLLARTKRRYRNEIIPGFGEVRIRSLSAREEFRMGTLLELAGDGFGESAILMIETLVDEQGNYLFEFDRSTIPEDLSDLDAARKALDPKFLEYIAELSDLDSTVLLPISRAVKSHLGLLKRGAEEPDPKN